MQKKLPIGVSDFKKLIELGYLYIDKSLLIKEVLIRGGDIILLPRPRRFGKTINMSMLKYFFEKTTPGNDHLFKDTAIYQEPEYHAHQGQYPVISLTFKDVKETTWQTAYQKMVSIIAHEFARHQDAITPHLSGFYHQEFSKILALNVAQADAGQSLLLLSKLLHYAYKSKVILLLDEYDSPIHAAFLHGYYQEMISFIRGLFIAGLKDNPHLERGVLTGIMRTAKEGIFSGLNNLKVCTLLNDDFSDKFGFTQKEIDHLLKLYDINHLEPAFKDWYNGYASGSIHVYNPWSAIHCIDQRGTLAPYWANTSDNALVKQTIAQADDTTKQELFSLIQNNYLPEKEVDEHVTFGDIAINNRAVWSFLLFTGYLTYSHHEVRNGRNICTLTIPNQELSLLYHDLIMRAMQESLRGNKFDRLLQALIQGACNELQELLQEFVINAMSVHDIPINEPEKSYHLFVLGILIALEGRYTVRSNRESGIGRYNIALIPSNPNNDPGILIEFKRLPASQNQSVTDAAQHALEQIRSRNYAQELQAQGVIKIRAYGMAFKGKQLDIALEEL